MIVSPMANVSTFAQWLKSARREKHMTQDDLAEKSGLGRTYISAVETGKVKLPQSQTRERIHNVLGTSDLQLVDYGLLAYDEFGNEYVPDRPEPAPVDVTGSVATGSARASGGTITATIDDPASRIGGLVKLVGWNRERERAVTKILTGYINADADEEEEGEIPF